MGTICVASQTPLIQFAKNQFEMPDPGTVDVSKLVEGVDYKLSPGGVSRMLYPLLTHMKQSGFIDGSSWISLNPLAPSRALFKGMNLNHVVLSPEILKGYGLIKEDLWYLFHGLQKNRPSLCGFWQDEYIDFTFMNRRFSELAYTLHRQENFDGFYIHDFQLLPMGSMLNIPEPKIFRWHIPFGRMDLPTSWHRFLLHYLEKYDAVVVSSRRYMEELRNFGYEGPAYHLYPYIDPSNYSHPTSEEVQALRSRFDIEEDDKVILTVARMDPLKAQDRAILAVKRVLKEFPKTKLLLVGNGSFSSSKGGIGLSKADAWRQRLKDCADRLHLTDNVIFAGYMGEKDLCAAYALSDLFVLPSVREGFGLVVVEAWLYKKPVIVSTSAGIADLIKNGENGLTFDPDDIEGFASKITEVLRNRNDFAELLGKNGFKTAPLCHIDAGVKKEAEILSNYLGGAD